MEKFVIDTSVAAKVFLENEPHKSKAIEIFTKAYEKQIALFAPSLIYFELNNALVKEKATHREIFAALTIFQQHVDEGNIRIFPPTLNLLNKTTEVASTDTEGLGYISAYDATFHALALLEHATLITADERHYKKTKDLFGSVMLLRVFPS